MKDVREEIQKEIQEEIIAYLQSYGSKFPAVQPIFLADGLCKIVDKNFGHTETTKTFR